MSLKSKLRQAGYDLIDNPIRIHKPLQLWKQESFNVVQRYYEHISHALVSNLPLNVIEDSALSVDYNDTQDYKFNIGITVLEGLLSSMGLGNLGIGATLKSGKKVSISYESSKTLAIPMGDLDNFLGDADFKYMNSAFMDYANRDRILVISGVLAAKNIKTTLETDTNFGVNVAVELNQIADGKVDFDLVSDKKLEMRSEGNSFFPIAIKANRIDWDKGTFKKTELVTDNRYFF